MSKETHWWQFLESIYIFESAWLESSRFRWHSWAQLSKTMLRGLLTLIVCWNCQMPVWRMWRWKLKAWTRSIRVIELRREDGFSHEQSMLVPSMPPCRSPKHIESALRSPLCGFTIYSDRADGDIQANWPGLWKTLWSKIWTPIFVSS